MSLIEDKHVEPVASSGGRERRSSKHTRAAGNAKNVGVNKEESVRDSGVQVLGTAVEQRNAGVATAVRSNPTSRKSSSRTKPENISRGKCFVCQQSGHKAIACPNNGPGKKYDVPISRGDGGRAATVAQGEAKQEPVVKVDVSASSLAMWASLKACPMSAADVDALQEAKRHGWGVYEKVGPKSGHAFSHAARDAGVLRVMSEEGQGKTEMTVLDWFGSSRTQNLCDPERKNVTRDGAVLLAPNMHIHVVVGPNLIVAGDGARDAVATRSELKDDAQYDVVLAVDIYQYGPFAEQAMTPEGVIALCAKSRSGRAYFLCRFFNGDAGADACGEGAWYRAKSGLINFSADQGEPNYATHPDVNWMQYRTYRGVDIAPIERFGPFHLVRCAPSGVAPVALCEQILPQPNIVAIRLGRDTFAKWFRRVTGVTKVMAKLRAALPWLPKKDSTVLVHKTYVEQHGIRYTSRAPNGMSLDNATAMTLRELCKMDPACEVLAARFPNVFGELVTGTTLALLYYKREEFAELCLKLRVDFTPPEAKLMQARSQNGLSVLRHNHTGLLVGGCVAAGAVGALAYKWKSASLLSNVLEACGRQPLPCWADPVLGVVEEFIKAVHPVLAVCFVAADVALAVRRSKRMGMGVLAIHVLSSMVGHYTRYGLCGAMAMHAVCNVTAVYSQRRADALFGAFLESYTEGQVVEAGRGWCPIPVGVTLPAFTSKVDELPVETKGVLEISVYGEPVTPEEALVVLDKANGKSINKLWPVLVTNRCLWTPAKNERNLFVALMWRVHRNMHFGLDDPRIRHERWRALYERMIGAGFFDCPIVQLLSVEECARLMGGERGRTILQALADDVKGNNLRLKKSINLKWNETVAADKEMGRSVSMKPRGITVLDPKYHVRMLPAARALAEALHLLFDGSVREISGVAVRIYFAAGYSQKQMNEIGMAMASGDTVIAVAGDDTAMAWGNMELLDNSSRFGESDLSSFEVTQDEGPMCIGVPMWMGRMGVPPRVLDMIHAAVVADYTIREGCMHIKGNTGVMLPTGIGFTTTINSVGAIALACEVIDKRKTQTIEQSATSLGLSLKYQERYTLNTVTFLKGWWCHRGEGWMPGHEGLVWMPLPSAVIKLGKLLRAPHEVVSLPRNKSAEAVKRMAYALSQSYGNVPDDYPILGEFLKTLRRLGMASKSTQTRFGLHEANVYKVQVVRGECDRVSVLGAIMLRYHIDPVQVCDVEKLLREINSLPAYVEHHVFDALCTKDYG